MKIKTKKEVEIVVGYECDVCGRKSASIDDMYDDFFKLGCVLGYYSKKDGERHRCDLCDKVREFIEKILGGKVRVKNYFKE